MSQARSRLAFNLSDERFVWGVSTHALRLFQTSFMLFASGLGILVLIQVTFTERPWLTLILQCVTAFAFYCNLGSFHDAAHLKLFRTRRANYSYGLFFGSLITLPFTAYRMTHFLHHRRLLKPDDWEFWPYCDPETTPRFRRIFVWFDLLFGRLTGPLIYTRIFWSHKSPLSALSRRRILLEGTLGFLVWAGLFSYAWRAEAGWGLLRAGVIPQLIAGVFQTVTRWNEHLGRPAGSGVEATRSTLPKSRAERILAAFTLQSSHQGLHHTYPQIPTRDLEFVHRTLPSTPSTEHFTTHREAIRDVFRALLRGPDSGTLLRDPKP